MTWQQTLPFFCDGRSDRVFDRVRRDMEEGREILPAWGQYPEGL